MMDGSGRWGVCVCVFLYVIRRVHKWCWWSMGRDVESVKGAALVWLLARLGLIQLIFFAS